MQGDVVRAAKWLSLGMVAASLVLVVGFHPAVTSRTVTIGRIESAGDPRPQPFSNSINEAGRCDNTPVGALVGGEPAVMPPDRFHGGIN